MSNIVLFDPKYTAVEEAANKIYLRKDKEPHLWYTIFTKYYLTASLPRSLSKAFKSFMREKDPSLTEADLDALEIPKDWYQASKYWEWEQRSTAYDEELDRELQETYKQRYKSLREEEFEIWEDTLALAKIALKGHFQKAQEAQDQGKPYALKVFDIERLINVGNKLGRQSLEKADVDRSKSENAGSGPTVNIQAVINRWDQLATQLETANVIKHENLLEGSYEEVEE